MKKFRITSYHDVATKRSVDYADTEMIVQGPEEMEVSDGYHTMDELYEHRIEIFIALCRVVHSVDFTEWGRDCPEVWRSKLHFDGSMYENWFVLGIEESSGLQITYHLPLSRWEDTNFARTLDRARQWDGHTSIDVLERLKKFNP